MEVDCKPVELIHDQVLFSSNFGIKMSIKAFRSGIVVQT